MSGGNQLYGADLQQTSPSGGHIGLHSAPTFFDAQRLGSCDAMRVGECVIDLSTGDTYRLDVKGVFDNVSQTVITPPTFTQIASKDDPVDLTTIQADIAQLQTDVADNDTDIANNAANITSNDTDITTLTAAVAAIDFDGLPDLDTSLVENTAGPIQITSDGASGYTATPAVPATDVDEFDELLDMDTAAVETLANPDPIWITANGDSTYTATAAPPTMSGPIAASLAAGTKLYHNDTTGDDDQGDGTLGNPFKTPKGAYDALWRRHLWYGEGLGEVVCIEATDTTVTTYAPPPMNTIPSAGSGSKLYYIASRQVVKSQSTGALTPVADKCQQWDVPISPVMLATEAPQTDTWFLDLPSLFAPEQVYGGVARTSPNGITARVVTPQFGPFIGATLNFYDYLTVYETPGLDPLNDVQGVVGSAVDDVNVLFVGQDFVPEAGDSAFIKFRGAGTIGVRLQAASIFVSAGNTTPLNGDFLGVVSLRGESAASEMLVSGAITRSGLSATSGSHSVLYMVATGSNPFDVSVQGNATVSLGGGGLDSESSTSGGAQENGIIRVVNNGIVTVNTFAIKQDAGSSHKNLAGVNDGMIRFGGGVTIDREGTVTDYGFAAYDGGNIHGVAGVTIQSGGAPIVGTIGTIDDARAGANAGTIPQNDFTALTGGGEVVK